MAVSQTYQRRRGPGATWELALLDCWQLCHDAVEVAVHRREQRLLALLGLQGARPRPYLAGMLWPDSTDRRAAGNLRAAVWSLDRVAPGLLVHDRARLALHAGVHVDIADFLAATQPVGAAVRAPTRPASMLPHLLVGELLPGWYDDWVLFERSRLQQLRLHALERLADLACDACDPGTALLAASTAVAIEPLRESAHRALVRAHLLAGNYHDALAGYHAFRVRLLAELGVAPSRKFEQLVRPLLDQQIATTRARRAQPALT